MKTIEKNSTEDKILSNYNSGWKQLAKEQFIAEPFEVQKSILQYIGFDSEIFDFFFEALSKSN